MKTVYVYDSVTKEYLKPRDIHTDPLASEAAEEDVYPSMPNSTDIEPPAAGDNVVAVFDDEEESWSLEADYRGTWYHKDNGRNTTEVTDIGDPAPEDYVSEAPLLEDLDGNVGFYTPKWNATSEEWEEGHLMYDGYPVLTKADVDEITHRRVYLLGIEEKAKTEKLIAGDGPCALWDTFISQRATILQEGEDFITENGLV